MSKHLGMNLVYVYFFNLVTGVGVRVRGLSYSVLLPMFSEIMLLEKNAFVVIRYQDR